MNAINFIEKKEKEMKEARAYESIIRTLTFATNGQYMGYKNGAYIFSVDTVIFQIFNGRLEMITVGINTYYANDIYTKKEINNINSILIPIFDSMMEIRELKLRLKIK